MKSIKKLFLCVIALWVIGAISINYILIRQMKSSERPYMMEIFRVSEQMKSDNGSVDLSGCHYVKRVMECENEEMLTQTSPYEYVIRKVGDKLYRFEYTSDEEFFKTTFYLTNGILVAGLFLILGIIIYIRRKIIKPFYQLEQVPYELSKGNLVMDLPEEKTKFFGRFIWGTNMLKEHLTEQRDKELSMHKDKKMLLLSLTHDIKTPLSVIKLNAQALSKNLYKEEEKRHRAAEEISNKVNEIEQYVSEIIEASREEFIDFSVKKEEVYLSSIINQVKEHYKGKMDLLKIPFVVDDYEDCLLSGDEDRLKEVFGNLIENAIKYGDGKKIQLSFTREQGCSLVTVSNTGSKLAGEETLKIFESFYRGSNVGSKKGNGLGLYICRKLMNNMNGDIFVSQKEDIFSITVVIKMV